MVVIAQTGIAQTPGCQSLLTYVTYGTCVVIDLTGGDIDPGVIKLLKDSELDLAWVDPPTLDLRGLIDGLQAKTAKTRRGLRPRRGRCPNPESETFRRPPRSCGHGRRPAKWSTRRPPKRRQQR